jgi:cell wall-associated NlpC family hydrolase
VKKWLVRLVVLAVVAEGLYAYHASAVGAVIARGKAGVAAVKAIAYARDQLGCAYAWGAAGPCSAGYDCSGLVMMAYQAAGISIARTSQAQWATEPRVSSPQPGDLAFFAGSDGTMTDPGHVGIVIGGGKMIEAHGAGVPVRIASWHRPDLVGFTEPAARGSA